MSTGAQKIRRSQTAKINFRRSLLEKSCNPMTAMTLQTSAHFQIEHQPLNHRRAEPTAAHKIIERRWFKANQFQKRIFG
jgi:hypothetical protein